MALIGSMVAAQAGQPALRRFYVYNECYKPIVHTAQYTPPGQTHARTNTVTIGPGQRPLVATEAQDDIIASIIGSARSTDGSLRWASRGIPSLFPELTYVIACDCDPANSKCQLPVRWPDPEAISPRQYPGEGP